jgi:Tfp pilus assembly protein PilN
MVMKSDVQILIEKDRVTFWHPQASDMVPLTAGQEIALGGLLRTFRRKARISGSQVVLFVAEELLFYKELELPLKIPNLKEAIGYQLGMITPFAEDELLSGFEVHRRKEDYLVHLYAARREPLEKHLKDLTRAGFQVTGLFPEHQRYLMRDSRRNRWGLVLPGRFAKILIFADGRLEKRLLSNSEPAKERLTEVCETEAIYHPQPGTGHFLDAGQLLSSQPSLKEFNMLPASYRRPDYLKMAIAALVALNMVALIGLAGVKVYHLQAVASRVENEISVLSPKIENLKQLQDQEQNLLDYTKRIEAMGKNPDLVVFLQRLTKELPRNSYLAQMRMDPNNNAIRMQGYTEDIGELTASLQKLGDTKLKSTSRRQNQTYFDLEVNTP